MHTPPRHLYGYETASNWRKYWLVRVYGDFINHFLRLYDYNTAQNVDFFLANSKETQRRIKKFYRRESKVIYPPVETECVMSKGEWDNGNEKDSTSHITHHTSPYYLCVSRLARAKHIDLAIKACQKLGEPLVVVGKGKESAKLKAQSAKLNSETYFLGEVSDEELDRIYKGAKALIFPAKDEEFGIVPVEAMGRGVPVIAYKSGGVQETVIEGKTGVFFDELTAESLIKTLKHKNIKTIKRKDCIKQAKKFSKERFKKEIKKFVLDKL